jgi:SOSS complex subunit C
LFTPHSRLSRTEIQNRKILEDIQLKKQLLQKAGPGLALHVNAVTAAQQQTASQQSQYNLAVSQSLGFYIPTDSAHGNSVLPVLPRFDN